MEDKKDIFDFIEKRPVETPDTSYFKGLADKVLVEVAEDATESKTRIVPLYKRPTVWLSGVAAAILVAFLLLPSAPKTNNGTNVNFKSLSKKEVLAYVDENIEDFEEELLMEFIPTENIEVVSTFTPTTEEAVDPIETLVETETQNLQESLESISNEEILEYLEGEGMDSEDDDDFFL